MKRFLFAFLALATVALPVRADPSKAVPQPAVVRHMVDRQLVEPGLKIAPHQAAVLVAPEDAHDSATLMMGQIT